VSGHVRPALAASASVTDYKLVDPAFLGCLQFLLVGLLRMLAADMAFKIVTPHLCLAPLADHPSMLFLCPCFLGLSEFGVIGG